MSVLAVLVLALTPATLPPPQPPPVRPAARDVDHAPIRCRPAPYYVSDTDQRTRVERILITGSRIPVREVEKRTRPCLLMRTMDGGPNHVARIAD
ncbi:MAG: hypothetical protein JNK30_15125 [Phenylobacterium sp.]|uniref:hypothetical protein n=1 Tax=Phenylobacterium sp. TaxID=1871053 RepID=UPI001A51F9C4|nr:hypothetical protein [Phenylobacterium sp.]MBL8772714.1 hypothetical protein [Phenylobacterium sp.]